MIKAIIFDFFGVIVTEGLTSFVDTYFADNPDKKLEVTRLVDDYNKGLIGITYDDFLTKLAELAKVPRLIAVGYLDSDKPNKLLIEYIKKELKPRYKIGMLSNAGNDWVSELLGVEDSAIFNEILLSFEYKMIKPHPEYYKLMARKLGVESSQCLLVDDIQRYCDGARAVDMQAIKYEDFTQFKKELNELLANTNN